MIRPVNLVPQKARLFRTLGEEGRLSLLEALVDGEQRVSELRQATGQGQSTVSTHLTSLHAAGLVERQTEGREARYRLASPSVARLLVAGEEAVLSTLARDYACTSPCCAEDTASA